MSFFSPTISFMSILLPIKHSYQRPNISFIHTFFLSHSHTHTYTVILKKKYLKTKHVHILRALCAFASIRLSKTLCEMIKQTETPSISNPTFRTNHQTKPIQSESPNSNTSNQILFTTLLLFFCFAYAQLLFYLSTSSSSLLG